ncbi:hypothetical protein BDV25DRAFT_162374 [Aspergillus avenaceus]|uniref:Uncharacterized protein n=1 Tax=Aspergillus avenaceus TaxID=36643 RepID=A0A5N6TJG8_ASPAV|nr:hypothetical protein BDV25DRAFT_162374 [Aspergillus avenaceus]
MTKLPGVTMATKTKHEANSSNSGCEASLDSEIGRAEVVLESTEHEDLRVFNPVARKSPSTVTVKSMKSESPQEVKLLGAFATGSLSSQPIKAFDGNVPSRVTKAPSFGTSGAPLGPVPPMNLVPPRDRPFKRRRTRSRSRSLPPLPSYQYDMLWDLPANNQYLFPEGEVDAEIERRERMYIDALRARFSEEEDHAYAKLSQAKFEETVAFQYLQRARRRQCLRG